MISIVAFGLIVVVSVTGAMLDMPRATQKRFIKRSTPPLLRIVVDPGSRRQL